MELFKKAEKPEAAEAAPKKKAGRPKGSKNAKPAAKVGRPKGAKRGCKPGRKPASVAKHGLISGIVGKEVSKALKAERKALKAQVAKLVAKEAKKVLKSALK